MRLLSTTITDISGSTHYQPGGMMLRFKFLAIVLLIAFNVLNSGADAQSGCGGQFPAGTYCGNSASSQGIPSPTPFSSASIPASSVFYTAPQAGGVKESQQVYDQERVSITDFGAVPDTTTAHALINYNAFVNALATGKQVFVPYTALGYNLGTNTVNVATGQSILCEGYVTIYGQGQTNSVFYVSGAGPPNTIIDGCKGQMGVNGSQAVVGSTFIRFATALGVVNGVTIRNIWCSFDQECVGDEGVNTASYITLQNIYASSTYARQFHITSSNGFLNLSQLNCDFSTTALSGAVAWGCGEFDGATGIFSNDWLAATNAGTGNTYNSTVQAWVFKNDNVLTLNIIKADATIGDGCLFSNVNNLTISQLNCGYNLGNQATVQGSAATAGINISNASPAVITWTAHGFLAEQAVYFTGSMPSGLSANVIYYVVGASITANSFEVSATPGGAALNTSSSATGLSGFSASTNVLINSATIYGGNANQVSSKAGLVFNSVVNGSVAGTQAFALTGDVIQITGASTNVTIQGNTATGNIGNWATIGANTNHVRFIGGANLGNGGGFVNSGTDACVAYASGINDTCAVLTSNLIGTVAVANGGTGNTSASSEQTRLSIGLYSACTTSINFNSANTDTAITLPALPNGFTRINPFRIIISNASHSLTTATYGVFPTTGGGGVAVIGAGASITVSGTTDASANNTQQTNAVGTTAYIGANLSTANTFYFRVVNAEGVAATADACLFYFVDP